MTRHYHHRHCYYYYYYHNNIICYKTSVLLIVILLYICCYYYTVTTITTTTTLTFALAFTSIVVTTTRSNSIHQRHQRHQQLFQHHQHQHRHQHRSNNNSIIMSPHKEEEEDDDKTEEYGNNSIMASLVDINNENNVLMNVHEKTQNTCSDSIEYNDSSSSDKLMNQQQQLNINNDVVKNSINEEITNSDIDDKETDDSDSDESLLLFTIGMIADIQYAPIEDGYNFSRTNKRYYRNSLLATKYAIEQFQNYHTITTNKQNKENDKNKVTCIIQLGDIIDGKCVDTVKNENDSKTTSETSISTTTLTTSTGTFTNIGSYTSLQDVINVLNLYTNGPIIHMYGNHCLYNMDRITMKHILNIPFISLDDTTNNKNNINEHILNEYKYNPNTIQNKIQQQQQGETDEQQQQQQQKQEQHDTTTATTDTTDTTTTTESILPESSELVGCYSYLMHPGYRCIVLDSYDISIIGRETSSASSTTSPKYQLANSILWKENTINMKNNNSNSPDGLLDIQKRFVAFNGGISKEQLIWLRNILHYCNTNNEYCIIVSHVPIHPLSVSTCPVCLLWNYNNVLDLFTIYSSCIITVFSGHAHMGGYYYDPITTIHYRIIEAILENIEPSYCIIKFYKNNTLILNGYGNCVSGVYKY